MVYITSLPSALDTQAEELKIEPKRIEAMVRPRAAQLGESLKNHPTINIIYVAHTIVQVVEKATVSQQSVIGSSWFVRRLNNIGENGRGLATYR